MSDRLRRLHSEHGQSPWLDNLQRRYVRTGHLERLIESGIRGLTSNPTIFQKAIEGSEDYDPQFAAEIRRGAEPIDAYWALVTQDIRDACDIFGGLHASSHGEDGWVSVEVDPRLAHDTQGTLDAAVALHRSVGRANVMIKIPATRAGLPAIRQLVARGCSVNVTLIFGLDRYREVMESYIAGLEERSASGHPLSDLRSVASFFISRVDSEIDDRLQQIGTPRALALKGTAAVNQAALAYKEFQSAFSGPRWERLELAGAHVQRPLWASTSTKNPAYPDTMYVDRLIGPHTVNTLPEPTLEAFSDHGTVHRTIDAHPEAALSGFAELADCGVDTSDVANILEEQGVSSFIASFEGLLQSLTTKARTLGGN